ncbi:MAG: hypothetical protein ACR2MG_07975 [Pyrinomonadaceae bacterium]
MLKIKLLYKSVPIFLIVSILLTACKIPDISQFTEASAEMTRAIRMGVTETDSILENASNRDDLFGEETESIQTSLKSYREATAPTLKTLKGLDAYLEALNALATAQKKSGENAEAAVTSVANLAAEVNVIKIPETAIKLGTGLLALAEVLRTERDFKKRVILTERIVNGGSADSTKPCTTNTFELMEIRTREFLDTINPENGTKKGSAAIDAKLKDDIKKLDDDIKTLMDENEQIKTKIEQATGEVLISNLKDKKAEIDDKITVLNEEKKSTQDKAEQKKTDLYNNTFVKLPSAERTNLEKNVGSDSCGVIDLLKINVKYLKKIYNSVATNLYRKTSNKNRILISYHDNVVLNDTRVQRELNDILQYKQKVFELSQYRNTITLGILPTSAETNQEIENKEKEIEQKLNSVYVANSSLQVTIKGKCQSDEVCKGETKNTAPVHQRIINAELDARELFLLDLNKRYTDDLQRINPAYTKVMVDLKQIKDKHQQMLKVFDGILEALDTWGETHSNLRDSLTAKKPFTAARLFSDVRFILATLKLGEANN